MNRFNVGDVVHLNDREGTHVGKVTLVDTQGLCSVKWDSGITERIHESELTPGAPLDDAYELDDPKHPTFRERLAELWDRRPGK